MLESTCHYQIIVITIGITANARNIVITVQGRIQEVAHPGYPSSTEGGGGRGRVSFQSPHDIYFCS